MGSSNRDYMKDDPDGREPVWGADIPTTRLLLVVSIGVFFLQTLLTHDRGFSEPPSDSRIPAIEVVASSSRLIASQLRPRGFGPQDSYVDEWFALEPEKVFHGQIWRLVTYVFCSYRGDDPFNLVFNMLMLWFLGPVLERMYGSRELLWFYLSAALACGLVFIAFGTKLFLPRELMGASPSVLAMLTLYATHFPRQETLFCWVIPIQMRFLLLIYVAVYVYGIMQAFKGHAPWEMVAYASGLWGIAFGYLYRRLNWRLAGFADMLDVSKLQRNMRRASTARTLKVFYPEPGAQLDEQVDAILAKIHEHGSESLTERERSILQRASDQAKNRL
jgi:membrane associated rhomboid family serine protease